MKELKELSSIYKKSFFGKIYKLNWRAEHLCNAVMKTTNLKEGDSIIDVGCATGEYVQEFQNRKIFAYGIEGSTEALDFIPEAIKDDIMIRDLRKEINFKKVNVALCLEVAEHLEEEYCDIFVKNLCNLSNYVIISAAQPGQLGHHHVNCQLPEYWDGKFSKLNYTRQKGDELIFKTYLEPWKKKKGLNAYYANTLIYKKD